MQENKQFNMEIAPGRAMFSPDEVLITLRHPKTYPEPVASQSKPLSANAVEFVPRFVMPHNNLQERLHKHQKQHIQQNYHQYQQQPQSYSNGYVNQQQQQQQPQPQQLPLSQSLNAQMASLHTTSLQDRLLNSNSGGARGGYNYQQQQQQQQQQQHLQQQNNHYRYNKNNYNPQHQYHHNQQQQRYNNHHNHNQHQQQQHQHQYHQHQQQSNVSDGAESGNDMENIALDYLQTVIQCLNQNPGQFDYLATRFITIFDGMENSHYVMSIAMEDIFNESIKNPNFRYMGAKLYNLFHMLNPSKDSLFHTLLEYKLNFHQKEVHQYMKHKQEANVRETALFLAELYMQLRGDDSRIQLIAENIVFSLKQLLSIKDNKDNMRCICLTLKLAGYDLTADCVEDMKDIISKLSQINSENPGKYPLASNVISLQKNNWGRKIPGTETVHEPDTSKPSEPLRVSDDPVFYGPDGREITAEECEFLTNGAADTVASSDNDDDVDLDPEMDEETERDFKQFLKQSIKKS